MALQLQPPCPLDMSSNSNLATNWKKFKEAFRNYEIAIDIAEGNDKRRVALFLHVIGEAGVEKYNTMTWAESGDKLKMVKVLENFEHCKFCIIWLLFHLKKHILKCFGTSRSRILKKIPKY